MHSQSGTAPSNQAAQVLYVAIELSKSAWVVAVQDRGKNRPSLHKLAAEDVDGLLAAAAKAQAQHGASSITCCYEIGYDGFWLARRLTALGWNVRLVEPASLQVDRRARRPKTDRQCGLELHPSKTRIVYCEDINRRQDHPAIEFTFLGYTFRPRKAVDKYGRVYVNFSPAVSRPACKAMRQSIRGWHMQLKYDKELADLTTMFDPILTGWQVGDVDGLEACERLFGALADAQIQKSRPTQGPGVARPRAIGATVPACLCPLEIGICSYGWMMRAG